MSTTGYFRATCGSLYRVTTTAATRLQPARTLQARRSTHATSFSPEYPTTPAEVARLVSIGSFTEVPCQSLEIPTGQPLPAPSSPPSSATTQPPTSTRSAS